MTRNDKILARGKAIQDLPGKFFKVRLEKNGTEVLGYLSGRMHQKHIGLLLDDVVDIELSPFDLTRGRIVFRHK